MQTSPESKVPSSLFSQLIIAMASAALVEMGVVPDPLSKKTRVQLNMARQNIDFIEMLKAKTLGNLTAEEGQLIEHVLTDLRMHYVRVSQKPA